MLLVSFSLFGLLVFWGLFIITLRNDRVSVAVQQWITQRRNQTWITVLLLIVLIDSIQAVIFTFSSFDKVVFVNFSNFLDTLVPFFIWGILFSLQSLVLLFQILQKDWILLKKIQQRIQQGLLVFLLLYIPWIIIAVSDFGFIPGTANPELRVQVGRFLPVTKPIPGSQVILVTSFLLIISFLLIWISEKSNWMRNVLHSQAAALVIIWGASLALWGTSPVESNYMIDVPEYAPGKIYPSSDGFYFDKEAHRFLAGEGFEESSTHVMYSFFLAGLHAVAGDGYRSMIILQFAVLGFIPVIIFRLTREISTPISAWIVALLYIFRERNGLFLGSELAGPLVSQFLSENLALLGMVLYCYLLFRWVQTPDKNPYLPAIAGGVMGISLLIRAEFSAVLFASALVALLILWKKKQVWGKGVIPLFLMVVLIISPWIYRNWQKTGDIYLDKGGFISKRLSAYGTQITGDETESLPILNDTEQDEFGGRLSVFADHAGNNYNHLFLFLPSGYQPLFGLNNIFTVDEKNNRVVDESVVSGLIYFSEDYLDLHTRLLPYYWYDWNGRVPCRSFLPVTLSILLVSIGVALTWKRYPKWVFLSFTVLAAQILIWAFAGFSGSRHVKAVDWIPLIFFGVGVSEMSLALISSLKRGNVSDRFSIFNYQDRAERKPVFGRYRKPVGWFLILVLILVGWGPTVMEDLIPTDYPEAVFRQRLRNLSSQASSSDPLTSACGALLTDSEDTEILYGQALYPRFFLEGERYPDHRKGTIPESYGSRIDFYLVGPESIWASLPSPDAERLFPHHHEVILIGKRIRNSYLEDKEDNQAYFRVSCLYLFSSGKDFKASRFIACNGPSCDLSPDG